MDKYDEDIYENPFFTTLQSEFSQLYEEATSLRCTLCIPQYSVVEKKKISEEDLRDHILTTQGDSGVWKTWSDKAVKIEENQVKIFLGQEENKVNILFEEAFYNNNDESYQVLCIENFLNRPHSGSQQKEKTVQETMPRSYEQCKAFLFGSHGGKRLQDTLDRQLDSFSKQYRNLASEKFIVIVEVASTQFTKAMQTVLKDSSIRRRVHENKKEMDMLKSAVEVYMMVSIHRGLFQAIQTNLTGEDAEVNRCARTLSDIKLDDLGVRHEFMSNIRLAKKELQSINKFSTPLGRLLCLKRVVSNLSTPTKDMDKKDASLMLTTDEFLPIMIYLLIKSEIPNWMANLRYMKEFHFSRAYNFDEFMFYLTTVEAAIEHIRSGILQKEAIKSYSLKRKQVNRQASGTTKSVDRFFSYVEGGDEAAVRAMLGKPNTPGEEILLQMCHPLCSCNKCHTLLRQNPTEKTLVTAYTRDDHGYTALHIAALHGQAHLVDLLVQHGAIVNASDYLGYTPLHLACQKGYQNIILLLIHFGADCTQADGVGNTPLHLCVDSGHEDCVKALVFTDKVRTKLEVNAQNNRGDTPLHLASKWGYESIIQILLDSKARTDIKNRKKQTPYNIAHNVHIQRIFQEYDSTPTVLIERQKSESLVDYEVVKVIKPHRDLVHHPPESPSSPPKLFTPEVASLDQAKNHRINLLFRAIENGDVPLVMFYMKWDNSAPETGSLSPSPSSELCHPLCQCPKCSALQQGSAPSENALNVNITDEKLFRPLHKACQAQNLDLVKLFINKGAQVNVHTKKGITPLHLAAINKSTQIVLHLLKHNAKVNARDNYGDTPLHLACYKSCKDTVDCLLMYQAKVNISNSIGNTPLHIAVKTGYEAVVTKLLAEGAYPLAKNKEGLTPFDLTKVSRIRDLLNAHITKRQLSATSPEVVTKRDSKGSPEAPDSIQSLFAAFEERSRENLQTLTSSIKNVDRRESLKQTPVVNDRSSPNLRSLRHSLSIQNFDLSGLRHVESLDRSEPLHIYRLVMNVNSKNSENRIEATSENSEVEDDVFSGNKIGDGQQINIESTAIVNSIHHDKTDTAEPLLTNPDLQKSTHDQLQGREESNTDSDTNINESSVT
ncbi:ankyrin repeat domain-containing protein 27-like isoform X2 [Saccostrea echinata]|uniref:ankyrin repeat domain-containing protein 27-like isoform X2 n=1 Tax=Saccostrea echinata TaxID=191078 RepID=UPI002A7F6993|nr:ankyrin repeat domain-containing protein 27-like isoform X2 [Saccostrea echinata]